MSEKYLDRAMCCWTTLKLKRLLLETIKTGRDCWWKCRVPTSAGEKDRNMLLLVLFVLLSLSLVQM